MGAPDPCRRITRDVTAESLLDLRLAMLVDDLRGCHESVRSSLAHFLHARTRFDLPEASRVSIEAAAVDDLSGEMRKAEESAARLAKALGMS